MPKPLLKPGSSYGVTEEGALVKLHIGNSALPMTWDVALRMSGRFRVAVRAALEYQDRSRVLVAGNGEGGEPLREAIRDSELVTEGGYKVFDDGPDVVLLIGNGRLTMEPEVGQNLAEWLAASGRRIQEKYAPDMALRFFAADLRDGNAEAMKKQGRRDSTATFH